MDVTVCCGTFGEMHWGRLAQERAKPSALAETPEWVHVHAGTLAEARNLALAEVETEFVIFLDADDELEPGYTEAMSKGAADLRGPAVRYIRAGSSGEAYVPRVVGHDHACVPECLGEGNWLVIGTAARTEVLRAAGGWREWPFWEDWDLWQRCWLNGASIEALPDAVYRAHVRTGSRNVPSSEARRRIHGEIIAANFPGVPV